MPKIKALAKVLKELRISNGVAAGLSLIDRNMRIVWINFEMKHWFNKNEELIGRYCYEAYQKKTQVCKGCPTKKVFLTGKVHEAFQPGITADGKKLMFQLTVSPIKDKNGKVIMALELVQDVTSKVISTNNQRSQLKKLKRLCNRLKRVNTKLRVDRERLKTISRRASYANEELNRKHRNLLKKLNYTREEVHDLLAVSRVVCSNGATTRSIALVTKLTRHLLCADVVTIRFIDNEKRILVPKYCLGLNEQIMMETPLKIGQSFEGTAAKTGKLLVCKDMQTDPKTAYPEKTKEENLHSAIFVPAVFNHEPLAVISAYYRRIREFNQDEIELLKAFASQVAIAIQETRSCDDAHKNYFSTLKALVLAMEARDPYSKGHSERVTKYALDIAKKLNLSENVLSIIHYAGTVHDVGKIGISDLILNKPGRLTRAERAIIELHPIKGAQMLEPLNFLRTGIPLVRHHHERFDGYGYPDRIVSEEIPLSARIVTCADAFDAMTSDRPYRLKKMNIKEAILELRANAGTQFDPRLIPIFVNLIKKQKYI